MRKPRGPSNIAMVHKDGSKYRVVWTRDYQPVTMLGMPIDKGGVLNKSEALEILWWWDDDLYQASGCNTCGKKYPRKIDQGRS